MSKIEIKNVSKYFGETRALKDITLTLEPDKIYGLLGRNGAGKTTLIKILTNKIFASAGEALIDGETVVENDRAQTKIFCMTEKNVYPSEMKVRDGFRWPRVFYPDFDTEYAHTLARKFRLDTGKRIKQLSSGYSSIFKSILTLASGAPVLIFDEPVLGMDAAHRELFYRELIELHSRQPKTIIISTHLIDEVVNVLEDVIIIKNGEIVLFKPVTEVLQLGYSVSGESASVDQYTRDKNVIHEEMLGKYKMATIYQTHNKADKELAHKYGLEIVPARLQELFISLTSSNEGAVKNE
jgi:ABC-2 type transport system ATP-binding protein